MQIYFFEDDIRLSKKIKIADVAYKSIAHLIGTRWNIFVQSAMFIFRLEV